MSILFKIKVMIAAMLLSSLFVPMTASAAAANHESTFYYVHDPRTNAKAMEDIVVDPNAVYGFSPAKDSVRLSVFADYDWTDAAAVEGYRNERIAYLSEFDSMYEIWQEMLAQGKAEEEIARAVSSRRNELRLASYKDDPEGLEAAKKSNLETYGNEFGPTPESLYQKYGSWKKVILKSFSSNSGMDACLGLYDDQYEYYILLQSVVEQDVVTYTVKQDDYLVKIAMKYFGDPTQWRAIYQVNADQIKSKDLIYEGQKLIIPLQ